MRAFALSLLVWWLVPHEIAVIWHGGAAGVELRALAGAAQLERPTLLEPDENPSEVRLELLWRF